MQFSHRMSLGPFLLGLLLMLAPHVIHFCTLSMITGLAENKRVQYYRKLSLTCYYSIYHPEGIQFKIILIQDTFTRCTFSGLKNNVSHT